MAADVVEALWRRILDPAETTSAWLALRDAEPVGLAHTILHPHTFTLKSVCYVEDLWVAPEARGAGIATALIGHLARFGEERGWRRIYWQTDADNMVARRLYDRIARHRSAVTYEIDLPLPPSQR
jgi:GNAT superfamily N-acetyltransferase